MHVSLLNIPAVLFTNMCLSFFKIELTIAILKLKMCLHIQFSHPRWRHCWTHRIQSWLRKQDGIQRHQGSWCRLRKTAQRWRQKGRWYYFGSLPRIVRSIHWQPWWVLQCLLPLRPSRSYWLNGLRCPSFLFCSVCSNFNIIPPSLSQRIQRPRHCYFFFLPPPKKKSKKWCSQQEGKLFSANPGLCWMTPEPNPPDLLMMRSATLFHQPTNNKQVARLFLRAVSS